MVQPTADPTTEGRHPGMSRSDGDLWFGHPRQLARLFTTEMWERFGFYGMRALLTLYLADHFLFRDDVTNGLYGAFTSLVYLTPLFGGLIADRLFGSKKSVKFGAIMMALGYFMLCFGGPTATPHFNYGGKDYAVETISHGEARGQYVVDQGSRLRVSGNDDGSIILSGETGASQLPRHIAAGQFRFDGDRSQLHVALMLLALSIITVGNGFFKPNISTIVGTLYAPGDRRRDAGFTIFYMGINLGSLLSQFLCPLLAVHVGWWAGFLLAAIGMVFSWSLIQFDGGRLHGYGETPAGVSSQAMAWVYVGALACVPLVWFLFANMLANAEAAALAARAGSGIIGYLASLPLLGQVLFGTWALAVIAIPLWAWRTGTREEWHMMLVAVLLCVFSVVFWTLFEQAGSSLTFFADRNTDRDLGWYVMPAGQVQMFNALFIVGCAPLMSILWGWLARRGWEPSLPVKFSLGLMGVGAGFLVLVFGTQFAGADYKTPLIWIALAYLIHSIAELCLSPVGLSMITKLSMARVVGLMMGVWFLSTAVAQYVAGIVAQFASVETVGGEVTNLKLSLDTYAQVFQTIGLWSIGIGVVLLAMSPLLKRWMHGAE